MPKKTVTKAAGLALGSSMVLMSLIPATSVLAASGPTSNPYITGVTTTVSGDTATASSVSQPGTLNIWYQFQVETPSGHWFIARRFGPGNTYTFVPPVSSSGTWMIEAYALTQYQVAQKMWGAAVGSTPEALSPEVSMVSIKGAPSTDVGVNDVITLTAVADNSDNMVVASNQQATWSVTTASGAPTSGASVKALASGEQALFEATTPGDYTVTATLDGLSSATSIDVYGETAGVRLTSQSATLVADGSARDIITATVVDANGNAVSNFNGTASVELTGDPAVSASTNTVTFTDGMGSFTIAGTATGNVTVALSNLTPAAGIPVASQVTYAPTTVTLAAPEPMGLMVSPSAATLLASPNESATVTVNLVDQLGNLIPATFASGFDPVTLNIAGPGSFAPGTTTTSETVYVAPGLSGTVTVYDPTGASGTISITASASGLATGLAQIMAVPAGIPAQIAVSQTTGTTSTSLTSAVNGINLSAGTEYAKYTVTLEDASGAPVPAPTAETFTITDNAMTGKAYVLTSLTAEADPITSMASDTARVTMNANQSAITFYVVNTAAQTQPTELTIATTNDYAIVAPVSAMLSASTTAPYSFVTGPATTVDLTGPGRIMEGQSGTYVVRLADINNNRVTQSGNVTFRIEGDGTLANGASAVTEPLDGLGVAEVTVYANSGATGTVTLTATMGTLTAAMTINVDDFASLVTNLAVETGSPLAPVPTSGLTLGGLGSQSFTVYELNGENSVVAPTDNVTVSVSNPSAVILENGTTIVAGSTLTLPASAFTSNSGATFTILGGNSGTATVTVADASNPAVPAVSFPVTVDALTVSAASLAGAGNVPGGIATITVNGLPTYAYYADNVADFAVYNQATGVLEMLTPEITSATAVGIYDEATDSYVPNTSNAPLAVWDISGKYYYLVLDEPTSLAPGMAPNTAYVGLAVTGPTGSRVQMAVASGAWDGNTGNTDVDYVPVATQNASGRWVAVALKNFTLETQVSLPSPGPTLVLPLSVESEASYVTNLAVETGSPLAPVPTSGLTLGGLGSQSFTVYELNGENSVVAPTDNVTVSVSNPSAVILENGTTIVAGSTLTLPASAFTSNSGATFTVLGGSSGTATVTVADSSNPSVPAVTFPVTVDALTVSAASLAGAGNVPGGIATITVNGLPTYAYYADNVADFAVYNQATGVLEMLTPEITSATAVGIYDEATDSYVPNTSNAPLAVWDISGKYYYLVLDEPTSLAPGMAPDTAYVGLAVTAPTGSRVQMAVASGAWDGNTGNTDVDYVPVASKTHSGQWAVVAPKSFTLTTQVSLPSPGPTLVYSVLVQEP